MHQVQPCCLTVRFLLKRSVIFLKFHYIAGSNQELHSYHIFGGDESPGTSLGNIETFNGSVKIVPMESDRLIIFGRDKDGSGLNSY